MKLVVFGLAVSSSWGNGHATLWRGLARALHRRGHRLVFFERDQSFYAAHRDLPRAPELELVLYPDWPAVAGRAAVELADADVGMVTSFCPDAQAAALAVLAAPRLLRCFYDLDTPVTLAALAAGEVVPYLPAGGLAPFDLVLSYTGGQAPQLLRSRLGARRVAPLYGSVDPEVHRPSSPRPAFAADLSYLGTYAVDRQPVLERLLFTPARRRPERRFVIAGAQYPADVTVPGNVRFADHLAPHQHSPFYASSPLTLNATRAAMFTLGYCPSARLFEAAGCGVPVLSDPWPGIESFFEPGREVLLASEPEQALAALELPVEELAAIGRRARDRALAEHTAAVRVVQLERLLDTTRG